MTAATAGATSGCSDAAYAGWPAGEERLPPSLDRWERLVAALWACAPELRLRTAYRGVLLAHLLVRAGHGWPPLEPPWPPLSGAPPAGRSPGAGPDSGLLSGGFGRRRWQARLGAVRAGGGGVTGSAIIDQEVGRGQFAAPLLAPIENREAVAAGGGLPEDPLDAAGLRLQYEDRVRNYHFFRELGLHPPEPPAPPLRGVVRGGWAVPSWCVDVLREPCPADRGGDVLEAAPLAFQ